MRSIIASLFVFTTLLLLPSCYSLPLCTDSTWPVTRNYTLAFCGYSGPTCCNATEDSAIQAQFTAMNINDSSCASTMKLILCAKCNPYSGELYTVDSTPRTTPVLCRNSPGDFCRATWNTCKDVAITSNPFSNTTTPTKLSDLYQSSAIFCMSAGGPVTDQTVCFNGNSATFPTTQTTPSPEGICIERLDNNSFLKMKPHPDGSNRIFLYTQAGKVFLAHVPNQGNGDTLKYNISQPFLDLTDRVYFSSQFGFQDIAFHPNFTQNGRFFVSYNCDSTKTPDCLGKCTCNAETGCDPAVIGIINGSFPCQYQEVVAEYTVNGTSSSPSTATVAVKTEVRRIITMGLPYTTQHAGEIFFGPKDGYIYLTTGVGGNTTYGDPWNFGQKKNSLLGKVLRVDVNKFPTQAEIDALGLWGNYSIPSDNPYSNVDPELKPEIWALGLRNPWRCNYDSERSSYLFCGETGQDRGNATFEETNLVTKDGNYGWRVYDGFDLYQTNYTPGGSTPPDSINPIFPILGYNHSQAHNPKFAALVAGTVYRAKTDRCLSGRFLYADISAFDLWAAAEVPYMSGNFTTQKLNFTCSKKTPIPCDFVDSTSVPMLSFIFSLGQDNNLDMYYIAQTGVYRIVRSVHCGYKCNSS